MKTIAKVKKYLENKNKKSKNNKRVIFYLCYIYHVSKFFGEVDL